MTAREYAAKMKEVAHPPSFEMGECTFRVNVEGHLTVEMDGDVEENTQAFTPEQALDLAKWLGEVFGG